MFVETIPRDGHMPNHSVFPCLMSGNLAQYVVSHKIMEREQHKQRGEFNERKYNREVIGGMERIGRLHVVRI